MYACTICVCLCACVCMFICVYVYVSVCACVFQIWMTLLCSKLPQNPELSKQQEFWKSGSWAGLVWAILWSMWHWRGYLVAFSWHLDLCGCLKMCLFICLLLQWEELEDLRWISCPFYLRASLCGLFRWVAKLLTW